MRSVRVDVAVWEDFAGGFTARTLTGDPVAATDRTAAAAVGQLKKFLLWASRRGMWEPAEPIGDWQLQFTRATVRPEYRSEQGFYPCDQRVDLRIAYVTGRGAAGRVVAVAPTLGLAFQCTDQDDVHQLAAESIRRALGGRAPRELARVLPPLRFTLTSISVKTELANTAADKPACETLLRVTANLMDRGLRRRFGRAWQRDRETNAIIQRLSTGKANLLLVGAAGVGKTSVLVDAAQHLSRKRPKSDEDPSAPRPTFWLTSGSRLIAGMPYLGQWENRCEMLIRELGAIQGVLCIDNLLELVYRGGSQPQNSLAAFFMPYLQRHELRMVAEATPQELETCRRLLPGLVDLFQIVTIEELDQSTTRRVLEQIAETQRQTRRLETDADALDLIYRLFKRFLPYRTMPGPAAEFLRRVGEQAELQKITSITSRQVLDRFTRDTGLPEVLLRDEIPLPYSEVLAELERHVMGQSEACRAAAHLVTSFKAGLNDPQRPLGVLLFCGPTGVGKTELAKTLARYLFGTQQRKDHLVRLDMSEYSEYGAGQRLLMKPDGEPTALITRVRRQPFSVILLDEIEKAAPEVFDVLLSLFDEGRLTDRFGRTTTFRSTILILTSNLGSEPREPLGFDHQQRPGYERAVTSFFRPELYNRLDGIVTFQPLSEDTIRAITRKELHDLERREGLQRRNLRLLWTEDVEEHLARHGFDVRYGARPLQRTLERMVVVPLARWLVAHPEVASTSLTLSITPEGKLGIDL